MTMHAPSDVRVISISQDNGGCGVPHELAEGKRSIDCPPCEQWLQKTPSLGWANHPGGVALTCDEIAENERAEKKAQAAGWRNLAGQMALAAGAAPAQAQPQSLVEQILALDPAQKQALLVLLGASPAPVLDSAPQAPVVDSTPVVDETPAAPKNRGGRPRKQVPAAA